MKINIVFLTLTSLAGAPIRIAQALNQYTNFKVRVINNNPYNYGNRTYPEDLIWEKDKTECLELISNTDILHLHHYMDLEHNAFGINLKKLSSKAKIVRHFHTNLEDICKWNNYSASDILNDKYPKLVIPHCPERSFPDAFVVPNIIPSNDEILMPLQTNNIIPKVFFSASSSNSMWDTRWNTKGLPEVKKKFKNLKKLYDFDLQIIQNMPYEQCQQQKRLSDIIIGDTTSGSYHLTDLEALSQGKPVFSYLDSRTQLTLTNLLKCTELPFINTRLEEINLPFIELLKDKNLQKEIGEFSRNWIETYYSEQILVKFFEEAYIKVLNDEPLYRQNYLKFPKAKYFLYNRLYDLQWEDRKKKNQTFFDKLRRK